MKLSIITINKNNAIGLEKTILSVINQNFDDFEYIVIDGQSKDSSVEIIRNHTNKIAYWVSEKDNGIYNAMNKGINKANGEYLLFLNSGDYLLNNDVLVKVFSLERNADFLCCNIQYSDGGKIVHTTKLPDKITFGTLYFQGLPHQATFIKRDTFTKYGLYSEDYKYIADIEYWYRCIILNCCSTQVIDMVISDYNLEGLSSQPIFIDNKKATDAEFERIMDKPMFKLFVPDYIHFKQITTNLYLFDWLKSRKILYTLIILLYKIEKKMDKFIMMNK